LNKIGFSPEAWEEYEYWEHQDKKTLNKIKKLIKEIQRHPFEGTGKPERLTGNLSGSWSRRIDEYNRMVYQVLEDTVIIEQLKTHYEG
jgi:toxin YoeB